MEEKSQVNETDSGWLNPAGWNGGMPPITMVAFALFLIAYIPKLKYRE